MLSEPFWPNTATGIIVERLFIKFKNWVGHGVPHVRSLRKCQRCTSFAATSLQASYLDNIMHMTWQKCVYCFRGSPAELVSTSTEHRTIQNASSPRYVIAWARPSPVSGHIIFRQSLSRGDSKRYQVNICG